jgi:hypothetical protein
MSDTDLMLPAAYRFTLEIEPAGFAWEFLRRNPAYRRTFGSGSRLGVKVSGRSRPTGG